MNTKLFRIGNIVDSDKGIGEIVAIDKEGISIQLFNFKKYVTYTANIKRLEITEALLVHSGFLRIGHSNPVYFHNPVGLIRNATFFTDSNDIIDENKHPKNNWIITIGRESKLISYFDEVQNYFFQMKDVELKIDTSLFTK